MVKPRQYRLRDIPTDVWSMVKDIQRTKEQNTGKSCTFESAMYELIRILYSKVSVNAIADAAKKNKKSLK